MPVLGPYRDSSFVGSRTRRMRPTRHRLELSEAVLARVVGRLEAQLARLPPDGPWATLDPQVVAVTLQARAARRYVLLRMEARRHRLAMRLRGERDPCRHGALRQAILQLDARIVGLKRQLRVAV